MPEPDTDEEGRGLLDDARAAFARDAVPGPVRDPGPVRGWGWLAGTVSRLESAERQDVPMDDSSWDRALGREAADDSRAERTDRREEPAYGVPARRGWGTESSRAAWRQQQAGDLQPGQRDDGAAPFGRPDDNR